MEIRAYEEKDVPDMVLIWNEVVEEDGTYQNIVLYYHTL